MRASPHIPHRIETNCTNASKLVLLFTPNGAGHWITAKYEDADCTKLSSSFPVKVSYSIETCNETILSFRLKAQMPKPGNFSEIGYQVTLAQSGHTMKPTLILLKHEDGEDKALEASAVDRLPHQSVVFENRSFSLKDFASSKRPKIEMPKILAALDKIKGLQSYSQLQVDITMTLPPPSGRPPFSSTVSSFKNILDFLFGSRETLSLVSSEHPQAQFFPHQKTVVMGKDFELASLSREGGTSGFEFTLAHEICHYAHELFLQKISSVRKSPSGLDSIYDGDLTQAEESSSVPEKIELGVSYARKHAEVDALALAALRGLGRTKAELIGAIRANQQLFNDAVPMHFPDFTDIDLISPQALPSLIDQQVRYLSNLEILEQLDTAFP